jgi:hypothetical protein
MQDKNKYARDEKRLNDKVS